MLLFRDDEHIRRWCEDWYRDFGATLSLDQAWQLARAWYARKMQPDWRRSTVEEAEALLGNLGLTGPFWSLR